VEGLVPHSRAGDAFKLVVLLSGFSRSSATLHDSAVIPRTRPIVAGEIAVSD
jgi:hypothetical protein